MELRDYQLEAVNQIEKYFRLPGAKVLYQLSTGGGKTEVACAVAQDWENDPDDPQIYWLTHRRELERQSSLRLIEADVDGVIVSSPAKLWNRMKKGQYVPARKSLLIADEAHHASAPTWVRIIKDWPGTVLGLTATPWRLSKKEGFDHLFESMVKGPPIQELISNGYLVPTIVRHPRGPIIEGKGNLSGEYSTAETWNQNDKVLMIKKGIDWLLEERNENSRTICYTTTKQHAHRVHQYALNMGLKSAVILGDTPTEERERNVERFGRGELNLLVCVEVITEGFDVPAIDSILILRPTQSLSLYLQMIGRSMRPAPGKRFALILDACGNWAKHGLPEEDRSHIWSLEARKEDGNGGLPPMRICTRCKTINHAASRFCRACHKSFGFACKKCGSFVYEDNGTTGKCLTCDDEKQKKMFESGVATVVSARPHLITRNPEKWGVLVDSIIRDENCSAIVTSGKGYRWHTTLTDLVGKHGNSYVYRTDGSRKFTTRINKTEPQKEMA